ncbi:hypothetical protein ACW9UR_04040 [Halovulum sp. GXIMD14794]
MKHSLGVAVVVAALCFGPAVCEEMPSDHGSEDRRLRFFADEPIRNGIMYFPYGVHTASDELEATPHNLVGLSYRSFSLAYFRNSYGGDTVALVHGRNLLSYEPFGADLFYGIMYGYHGELAESDNMPSVAKPLFEGEINPVASVSPYWRVTERLELRAMLTPFFATLGVKVNF